MVDGVAVWSGMGSVCVECHDGSIPAFSCGGGGTQVQGAFCGGVHLQIPIAALPPASMAAAAPDMDRHAAVPSAVVSNGDGARNRGAGGGASEYLSFALAAATLLGLAVAAAAAVVAVVHRTSRQRRRVEELRGGDGSDGGGGYGSDGRGGGGPSKPWDAPYWGLPPTSPSSRDPSPSPATVCRVFAPRAVRLVHPGLSSAWSISPSPSCLSASSPRSAHTAAEADEPPGQPEQPLMFDYVRM